MRLFFSCLLTTALFAGCQSPGHRSDGPYYYVSEPYYDPSTGRPIEYSGVGAKGRPVAPVAKPFPPFNQWLVIAGYGKPGDPIRRRQFNELYPVYLQERQADQQRFRNELELYRIRLQEYQSRSEREVVDE